MLQARSLPKIPSLRKKRILNAFNPHEAQEADNEYRNKCGRVWRQATLNQRKALYDYTIEYENINQPLRGYEFHSGKFLGVGKVDLNSITSKKGREKKQIQDMTDVINKSSYNRDVILHRGVSYSSVEKLFGVSKIAYKSQGELEEALVGKVATEHGFCSTGVIPDASFDHQPVLYKIFAPKGTKMMYMEPFSNCGQGAQHYTWDGNSKQINFGAEQEMLLQRGTKFRVRKVEWERGKLLIELDVVGNDMQEII